MRKVLYVLSYLSIYIIGDCGLFLWFLFFIKKWKLILQIHYY